MFILTHVRFIYQEWEKSHFLSDKIILTLIIIILFGKRIKSDEKIYFMICTDKYIMVCNAISFMCQ